MHYQTGVTTRQLLVESGLSRQLIAVARPPGHLVAMTRRFDVERGLTFAGEDGSPGPLNGPQLLRAALTEVERPISRLR
jgi:hypothetical protein